MQLPFFNRRQLQPDPPSEMTVGFTVAVEEVQPVSICIGRNSWGGKEYVRRYQLFTYVGTLTGISPDGEEITLRYMNEACDTWITRDFRVSQMIWWHEKQIENAAA